MSDTRVCTYWRRVRLEELRRYKWQVRTNVYNGCNGWYWCINVSQKDSVKPQNIIPTIILRCYFYIKSPPFQDISRMILGHQTSRLQMHRNKLRVKFKGSFAFTVVCNGYITSIFNLRVIFHSFFQRTRSHPRPFSHVFKPWSVTVWHFLSAVISNPIS